MLRLRVKEVVKQKKLSMNKLSHRSEVSYNVVKESCRNPYRVINSDTINRMANALGVPATAILEDVSEEFAAHEKKEKKIKEKGKEKKSKEEKEEK